MTAENKKLAELEFEKHYKTVKKDDKMDEGEFSRRIETLELDREIQMNEIMPKNIFNNKKYDNKLINKYFEKKKSKLTSNELTKYSDDVICPTNEMNECSNAPEIFISNDKEEDDSSIDLSLSSDTDEPEEDIMISLEKELNERKKNDAEFETFMDKGLYKSAIDDKFGVSNAFGFMVGTDTNGNQSKNYNIDKKYEEVYKQLTQ